MHQSVVDDSVVMPPLRDLRRHLPSLLLAVGICWFGIALIWRVTTLPTGRGWIDTYVYLDGAHLMLTSPHQLYTAAAAQMSSPHALRAFIYPPSSVIPFLPLSALAQVAGYPAAATVWLLVDAAGLVAGLLLIVAKLNLRARVQMSIVGIAMVSAPWSMEALSGQVNGVLLLLLALTWRDWHHNWRAGVWIGLGAALKPAMPLLVLLPLIQRRWRMALVAVCIPLLLNAALLPQVGLDPMRFYLTAFLPWLGSHPVADANNISPAWLLSRLLGAGSIAATAVWWLVRIVVAAAWLVTVRRSRDPATVIPVSAAASVALTPTVWIHYLVLCLPLGLVVLARTHPMTRRITVAALLITGVHVGYITLTGAGGLVGIAESAQFIAMGAVCFCLILGALVYEAAQPAAGPSAAA